MTSVRQVPISVMLLAGLALFAAASLQAESLSAESLPDAQADAVLERITEAARRVDSVQADFIQEKHLAIFNEPLVSRGRLALKKPDALRWEYLSPVVSGFAVRGGEGERWNELSGQSGPVDLSRDPVLGVVVEQLLAWAAVDLKRLDKDFRLAVVGAAPPRLRLEPRSEGLAGVIESIAITFGSDARHIDTVRVNEPGGDFTRIVFSNARLNTDPPDALFGTAASHAGD